MAASMQDHRAASNFRLSNVPNCSEYVAIFLNGCIQVCPRTLTAA